MSDKVTATGLEILLTGVPYGISDNALKKRIAPLFHIDYDFLVILTKSSEDMFWESLSGVYATNTARVILPDDQSSVNPGCDLIHQGSLLIDYKGKEYKIAVRKSPNSAMINNKYAQLRGHSTVLTRSVKAVRDGILGDIQSIRSGNFDHENRFETTHEWSPRADNALNKFSYYGDGFPKKFQICLTGSNVEEWEWMDLHEPNIRGIIFEDSDSDAHSPKVPKVVYFVVDKPPQFYQRARNSNTTGRSNSSEYIHTRIVHPVMNLDPSTYDRNICDVAGVPWVTQYSRVFRIVYEPCKTFTFVSYEPRISQSQKDSLVAFHLAHIQQSERTVADMIQTLVENITMVTQQFRSYSQAAPECQVAVLRLFYNCNIRPLLQESARVRKELVRLLFEFNPTAKPPSAGPWGADVRWRICDALKRSSQDMETSHIRALRRLCASSIAYKIKEPEEALFTHLGHFYVFSGTPPRQLPLEVFELLVYPSHTEIKGPIAQGLNSVIEKYRGKIDRFLRIYFVDNNKKPFRMEAGISPDTIIDHRVVQVLLNHVQPLQPIEQRFEFLGIGNWDTNDPLSGRLARNPSKWGARLALAFTESYPVMTLFPHEWEDRADVGYHKEFANTDGCGLISPELCKIINQGLKLRGFRKSQAFQIRFGGAKGVVYSGVQPLLDPPNGKKAGLKMLLRKSQVKFNVPDSPITLRIVSTAGHGPCSLSFAPVIKALENSGVAPKKIEEIYNRTYGELRQMSSAGLETLQEIRRISMQDPDGSLEARYMLLQLAICLKDRGISPENYPDSFLKFYLIKLAERSRSEHMFEIPIPNSYQLLGLTDDYQILGKRQVYIRARERTISGKVLIYRDPIIHIGDIQEATALSDRDIEESSIDNERLQAMKGMDNIIFFSQMDTPPFPNLLSGGNLDGDRFEILTGFEQPDCWLKGFESSPADDYTKEGPKQGLPPTREFDIQSLARFIGQYIRNDCFTELQDIHMCLADERVGGLKDPDVMALAQWLSQAVDYAKSGVKVDLYADVMSGDEFRVGEKPDLVRGMNRKAFYDSKGEYYASNNLLGRIFRKISSLTYPIPNTVDDTEFLEIITDNWNFQDIDASRQRVGWNGRKNLNAIQQGFLTDVDKEFGDYRRYLEAQKITQKSEMNIFLRDKLDDFPQQQLERLSNVILSYMHGVDGLVRDENFQASTDGQSAQYTFKDRNNKVVVDHYYRHYLFLAW